jgi:hypothetical protein
VLLSLACIVSLTLTGIAVQSRLIAPPEMDYMTLSGVILLSAGMGTAYNFVLVMLPLFIFWSVRPAMHKPEQVKPNAAV